MGREGKTPNPLIREAKEPRHDDGNSDGKRVNFIHWTRWDNLMFSQTGLPPEFLMPLRQQIFALAVSVLVFIFIIDMVRRRRLREEYSVLWLVTSVVMFVLVFKYEWLVAITYWIGATSSTTTLTIGSLVFLLLLSVQFCIKISRLTNQVKDLSQENALLRKEVEILSRRFGAKE